MDHLLVVEHATWREKQLARIIWYTTLAIVLAVILALGAVLAVNGYDKAKLAWDVATVFVLCTLPISTKDIQDHLLHFEVPEFQKYEIRILLMVPIYSLTSWICLFSENQVLYRVLDAFRSLYEAFVIWNFAYFLCSYLGPTEEMLAIHLESKPQERHIWPVSWILRPWKMGHEFLFCVKSGTLQYVFWKILNVFIVIIASIFGVYGDGEWTPTSVYFLTTGVTNVSQMLALYCLILFYNATHADLANINPLAKFLCVKLVVFFCFWQGCLISVLVYIGVIKDTQYFTNSANTLQDFIVCIEMLCFAIAHHNVFSYKDFARINRISGGLGAATVYSVGSDSGASVGSSFGSRSRRSSLVHALLEAANPRDLIHDFGYGLRFVREGSRHDSALFENYNEEGNPPILSLAATSMEGYESTDVFCETRDQVENEHFSYTNMDDVEPAHSNKFSNFKSAHSENAST